MVWVAIACMTHSSLVWININLIGSFLASYVQWLFLILEACQMSYSHEITQDHLLQVVFWTFRQTGYSIARSPASSLFYSLKTSGHAYVWDWPITPLQLIRLIAWVIDLKQHEMYYPFLSFKPSLFLYLTRYGPFFLPGVAAVSITFAPLNLLINLIFMPCYLPTTSVHEYIFLFAFLHCVAILMACSM